MSLELIGSSGSSSTTVAFAPERAVVGGTPDLIVPGMSIQNVATGITVGANLIVYMPCFLTEAKTLLSLNVDVTTNVAATNLRIGLYRANSSMQPGALVLDSGNISSATTGKKTYATSTPLTAGSYLAAVQSDGAIQIRGFQANSPFNQPINAGSFGGGANILRGQWRKAVAFAAFTDPGTAWDTSSDISASPVYPLVAFGF